MRTISSGTDRRVSYVQDRGTFRDFSQGAVQQTSNPLDVAIDGAGMFAVQAPRRRALHPRRQSAAQQHGPAGHRRTAIPCSALPGPIVFQPTDHDIVVSADGTITVQEGAAQTDSIRGKLRMVSFTDAQKLIKQGNNLYCGRRRRAPQPTPSRPSSRASSRSRTSTRSCEMSHMVEVMRTYTNIANILQQQSDLHKSAIDKLADVPA